MLGRGVFLALGLAGVGLVLYLKHLKTVDDSFTILPPSIEQARQAIERTTDVGAGSVRREIQPTTIKGIRSMARPAIMDQNRSVLANKRVAPLEVQVWSIDARVTEAIRRVDGDFYLVIEEDGARGCVEVPDPRNCKGSPFLKQIMNVRDRLQADLAPSFDRLRLDRKARLVGIGYFGTKGKYDNGARLLPLLDYKWLER